ncbi:MAG TPA: restriction endonuclease subunit S [Methanothrix soehngenii]|nr:restriction endonuclease subunit S [Methanothrix soehngenii]
MILDVTKMNQGEHIGMPIFEYPVDWELVRLQDLCLDIRSGFPSGERDDKGIIQIRMNNIGRDGHINLDSVLRVPLSKNVDSYLLENDDVLFNNTNSIDLIGKTAIFRNEYKSCTYSNHITRIKVDPNKTLAEWLLYNLIKKWEQGYFRGICQRHVGQAGIALKDLKDTLIPKPPLSEQLKVTSILSSVDAAIEQTDAIIAQMERVKKSLMRELFSKGVAHKKFKITPLGLIPDNWKIKTIDELKGKKPHAISMGPFGSNIKTDNFISSGIPVIRGVNLASLFVRDFNFVYLSEKKADELIASNAYPRDIVITHRGTIGQVSIIPDSAKYSRYVVSQSQMKLTCDESIVDPYFLNYYFNSPKGQYLLLRNKAHTGVPALGQPTTSLKDILVPIPDIGEQKLISSILSSAIDRIGVEQKYLETLKLLKSGLMQGLLSGRVPVKVDGHA